MNALPRTAEEAARIAATVLVHSSLMRFPNPRATSALSALDCKVGDGRFRKIWVSAPSSTLASDGLGPLYNARGCPNRHLKVGSGHPPEGPKGNATSMILRISNPSKHSELIQVITDVNMTEPDPTYGLQF